MMRHVPRASATISRTQIVSFIKSWIGTPICFARRPIDTFKSSGSSWSDVLPRKSRVFEQVHASGVWQSIPKTPFSREQLIQASISRPRSRFISTDRFRFSRTFHSLKALAGATTSRSVVLKHVTGSERKVHAANCCCGLERHRIPVALLACEAAFPRVHLLRSLPCSNLLCFCHGLLECLLKGN